MTRIILLAVSFLLFLGNQAYGCTDFRLTAKDGTILITRSMEFALDMKSNLRTSTRGRVYSTTTNEGQPALSWKAKYGYIFLDGLNVDVVVDGMNEAGLSFEALFMPHYAVYQTIPKDQNNRALPYMSLGDWVLSQFQTVDEVKEALKNIYVFSQKLPNLGETIFPLHFSVFDSTGKGIVIEYLEGAMHIYDNPIGVMTNSPSYPWHVINLVNYIHLAPNNPNPVVDNNITFAATGQGFGMIGLPGDISPPSRFVKTAALTRVVLPAKDALSTLNLAEHIINNVDIPLGLAREPDNGNQSTNESTEWVVFKDLTHKMLFYRTYTDLSLRGIELSKLDFSENATRLKMAIASPGYIKDITDTFKATKPPVAMPQKTVSTLSDLDEFRETEIA